MDTYNNALENLKRVVITAKDIALLTGRTERSGRMVMRKIRQHFGKTKGQLVSVSELAVYFGIPLPDVISLLGLRK